MRARNVEPWVYPVFIVHEDNAKQRKKWGYKTQSAFKIKLDPMYDEKKSEKFKIRIAENLEFALTFRVKVCLRLLYLEPSF